MGKIFLRVWTSEVIFNILVTMCSQLHPDQGHSCRGHEVPLPEAMGCIQGPERWNQEGRTEGSGPRQAKSGRGGVALGVRHERGLGEEQEAMEGDTLPSEVLPG